MTSPTDDWLDKQPKITHDEGINALRRARQAIEASFATAGREMVEMRHTIQALEARIAELELVQQANTDQHVEDTGEYQNKLAEAHRAIDRLTERCCELVEARDLAYHRCEVLEDKLADARGQLADARYHADDTDQLQLVTTAVVDLVHVAAARTHNVMRLAAAANHHLHHGRIAIAQALLTPLIEGKHDAHRYDEAAGNSREARPEPDNKDHGDNGPAWRVPEGWAQVESD